MPGAKKTLKKKKKISKKPSKSTKEKNMAHDPIKPVYVPPPPILGQKLLKVLQDWKSEKLQTTKSTEVDDPRQTFTSQEIRDLRFVFKMADMDGAGFLKEDGVQKALDLLGFVISDKELRRITEHLDTNEGKLNFKAFQQLVADWHGGSRDYLEEIKQGFSFIDHDHDGKITIENLKHACLLAGLHFSRQELEDMMEEADRNGDHEVDLGEFLDIMLKTNLF
ncbi:uncharacterized protein [Ambystoma mexicanum]|uniref:uncharacterized protein n=1 Tax=Ambystoma mexicanum TaxID=8296 RepID=UPI0037E889A9